jgi:hypothetical protein
MGHSDSESFEQAGHHRREGLLREFALFVRHNRKFWLIPLLLVLLTMSGIIMLGGTAAAPFIYTLF